jgi:hypothetical protein
LTAPDEAARLEAAAGRLKANGSPRSRHSEELAVMSRCLLALGLGLVASVAHAAACAPPAMVRMVVRDVTPGMPADGHAAKPWVTYRQGSGNIRMEEAEDPARKLHLLIVTHEPDTWFVNLTDNSGNHIVDPGPTFAAHAPIFTGKGVSPEITALEYGCEAAFVAAKAPKPESRTTVGGEPLAIHVFRKGEERVEISMTAKGAPRQAAYYRGQTLLKLFRYDAYVSGMALNPVLFSAPKGVAYAERK